MDIVIGIKSQPEILYLSFSVFRSRLQGQRLDGHPPIFQLAAVGVSCSLDFQMIKPESAMGAQGALDLVLADEVGDRRQVESEPAGNLLGVKWRTRYR